VIRSKVGKKKKRARGEGFKKKRSYVGADHAQKRKLLFVSKGVTV